MYDVTKIALTLLFESKVAHLTDNELDFIDERFKRCLGQWEASNRGEGTILDELDPHNDRNRNYYAFGLIMQSITALMANSPQA